MARPRLMQIGQHHVDDFVAIARINVEVGPALAGTDCGRRLPLRDRLQRSDYRGADGNDTAAALSALWT